jgi:hypothetical protein
LNSEIEANRILNALSAAYHAYLKFKLVSANNLRLQLNFTYCHITWPVKRNNLYHCAFEL